MSNKKMSKVFFFQMIEKRLNDLDKEVEKVKANTEMPMEQRIAKENILFGRLLELYVINSAAMNIDYWKYTKLEEKIRAVQDKV